MRSTLARGTHCKIAVEINILDCTYINADDNWSILTVAICNELGDKWLEFSWSLVISTGLIHQINYSTYLARMKPLKSEQIIFN